MKKWGITSLAITFYLLFSAGSPSVVKADEPVNFSIEAIPNEFQVDSDVTYFDLRMAAEQKTNVRVRIYNHGSDDQTFLTSVRNATTNGNGLIVYEQKKPLALAPVSLTDMVRPATTSTFIKSGKSKVVSLPLHIPNELTGTVLAGIRVEKKFKASEAKQDTIGIQNRHAYVIGLKVRSEIKDLSPKLTYEGIQTKSYLTRPNVLVKLANQAPTITQPMKFETVVTKNKKVVVRKEMDVRFAPSTYMTVPIETMGILKAGTYQVAIHVEEKERTWTWNDEFKVTEKQVRQMEEKIPKIEKNPNSFIGEWSKELMIASTWIIVFLLGYIYRLKKQQHTS
ncbi:MULTISPECIES: DUF916 domain-containing protein [Exiguobacterium]|uniref:DUF916 domain-containing protein n=1 Tax=Exiguobacterium TaxID=33986 RepID=UPI001AEB1B23|nr:MULTISPECIES: DUF916 domain-containing protein [Exiguobacterium]MCT4780719.1 DUF916 and DUF3324 domain-containing protein [Exiguobacterium soli]